MYAILSGASEESGSEEDLKEESAGYVVRGMALYLMTQSYPQNHSGRPERRYRHIGGLIQVYRRNEVKSAQ